MAFPLTLLAIMSVSLSLARPGSSYTTCDEQPSDNGRKFEHCNKLPYLDAVLRWTYIPENSTLSMSYTAPPPTKEGWVAWGLNPKGTGMAGTQALLAARPEESKPPVVDRVDIESHHAMIEGLLSTYNVTDVEAVWIDDSITFYATWANVHPAETNREDSSTVNIVWQAGPITPEGLMSAHPFNEANLRTRMRLCLVNNKVWGMPPASSPAYTSHGDGLLVHLEPVPGVNGATSRVGSVLAHVGLIATAILLLLL